MNGVAVSKKTAPFSNKFLKELSRIPPGETLASHLETLKLRNLAHDHLLKNTKYPKNIVEDRF